LLLEANDFGLNVGAGSLVSTQTWQLAKTRP
jgi:hypothetical protein